MSPSTHKAQEAFKVPGTYTCRVCNTSGKGGQASFYGHWLIKHYRPKKNPTQGELL
jgi:hypothetical protein